MRQRSILWFRQDLRLHDNQSLVEALKSTHEIIPVFVFDTRCYGKTYSNGQHKTGLNRTKFIIEAIHDLRNSLRKLGSDLYVRVGITEDIIAEIANSSKSSFVFCNRERTREEVYVQDSLEQKLWEIGREVRYARGKMLYYTADLPFPVSHTPDHFQSFKKEVDRLIAIRKPFDSPTEKFEKLHIDLEPGDIPTIYDFGFIKKDESDLSKGIEGGESKAKEMLEAFIESSGKVGKELDLCDGNSPDMHLSAYLSAGCISPKYLYHRIIDRKSSVSKQLVDSIKQKLIIRDYLRLMGKKYRDKIFVESGIAENQTNFSHDDELIDAWKNGQTGRPLIDAIMIKLNKTGLISNIARKIVARYLVYNLKQNWKIGAYYFETKLLDYDPCSNWVNWNVLADVGPENIKEKELNVTNYSKRYDPEGCFIRHWLPQLSSLPKSHIHCPECLSEVELLSYGINIGKDYTFPLDQNQLN